MRLVARTLTLALAVVAAGCSEERTPAPSGGVHPAGWADPASASFHGTWLAHSGFPLPGCQQCHGQDYDGGAVGIGCTQSGCHSQAPIACTTCHGSRGTPRPATGAHWAHQAYCENCHAVPEPTTAGVQAHASGDASTIIHFSGVAVAPAAWQASADGGADAGPDAPAAWDARAQRCTNTYCHGAASPVWTTPVAIGCDGCHAAPPADHGRWSRVASSTSACESCHPSPATAGQHVDGVIEVTVTSCTACHGQGDHPYPPLSLDGSTASSSRGVGAHVRHLDGTLADRISAPLPCNDCHVEPTAVVQPGHFDQPQAVVRFPFGGTYDASSQTCTVWCHFERSPGPVWTNDTGSARQCGSCHDFPPAVTRTGAPHPSVPGDLTACQRCHPFGPSSHVNGVVDFLP